MQAVTHFVCTLSSMKMAVTLECPRFYPPDLPPSVTRTHAETLKYTTLEDIDRRGHEKSDYENTHDSTGYKHVGLREAGALGPTLASGCLRLNAKRDSIAFSPVA